MFGLAGGVIILIRGHLARALVAADCFRRNSQAPLASWQSQDPDAVPTASRGYTSATGLLWSLLFFENQLEWEMFLSPWYFHFVSLRAIVKASFSTVAALLLFWARSFFVGVGAVPCLAGGLAPTLVSYLFRFAVCHRPPRQAQAQCTTAALSPNLPNYPLCSITSKNDCQARGEGDRVKRMEGDNPCGTSSTAQFDARQTFSMWALWFWDMTHPCLISTKRNKCGRGHWPKSHCDGNRKWR